MTIKAIIFDMDGVLIDSEPVWKQAGIDVFNAEGIPVTYDDMLALTGIPSLGIVKAVYEKYQRSPVPVAEMAQRLNDHAISLILAQKPLIDGVQETLQKLTALGYKLAVASASPRILLEEITQSCGIDQYFSYLSSATELSHNKPHPAVWLHAAEMLGVEATECIGIEDSVVGMVSVKAASMKCIVVPGVLGSDDPRWALADIKLATLREIDETVIGKLASI
ncbi:hexitol phosphatase HxpB [Basfia succiniciproducens]|uniref:hexitol phosphatase HxpB n=1 Tax=Basfia succiniciproducens TaxID=653940 RepID=UPI0008CD43E8|nr:hexitol phosphatase HxpB [Basfia succiniciproducens]SEP72937.1 sugar-phosphatase [Basfia succiniciproducens]